MIEAALVSCDDHLDLSMLPANVLADRMSARWGDRAPRVDIPAEGFANWIADGHRWGFWSGKKVEQTGPKPIHTAYDRGGIEDPTYRRWRLWECKEYWDDKGGIPHRMKPSEVFQRQVYGTFQQSPTAMRLLEFRGPENLLWASDHPHPDSIWPNSRRTISETMGDLEPDTVRRLVGGNAAKLYGLDLGKATVRAQLDIGYEAVAAE